MFCVTVLDNRRSMSDCYRRNPVESMISIGEVELRIFVVEVGVMISSIEIS